MYLYFDVKCLILRLWTKESVTSSLTLVVINETSRAMLDIKCNCNYNYMHWFIVKNTLCLSMSMMLAPSSHLSPSLYLALSGQKYATTAQDEYCKFSRQYIKLSDQYANVNTYKTNSVTMMTPTISWIGIWTDVHTIMRITMLELGTVATVTAKSQARKLLNKWQQ